MPFSSRVHRASQNHLINCGLARADLVSSVHLSKVRQLSLSPSVFYSPHQIKSDPPFGRVMSRKIDTPESNIEHHEKLDSTLKAFRSFRDPLML
jgi:hypothetical protein